ncbi:MAG: 4Fe-4S cluster-binding domain-containing protein, partial [Treponema sp.]|nr:4Fe-4S cluster-binding domain-containing protein [Treponema sp.]
FFITHWYWSIKGLNCVMELHTALSMNCSLKCKSCNMFVPFYEKSLTYDLNQIKEEVDTLFKYVDYVFCYTLLGGEPFLYKHFDEVLQYIAGSYRDKIGTMASAMRIARFSSLILLKGSVPT